MRKPFRQTPFKVHGKTLTKLNIMGNKLFYVSGRKENYCRTGFPTIFRDEFSGFRHRREREGGGWTERRCRRRDGGKPTSLHNKQAFGIRKNSFPYRGLPVRKCTRRQFTCQLFKTNPSPPPTQQSATTASKKKPVFHLIRLTVIPELEREPGRVIAY